MTSGFPLGLAINRGRTQNARCVSGDTSGALVETLSEPVYGLQGLFVGFVFVDESLHLGEEDVLLEEVAGPAALVDELGWE